MPPAPTVLAADQARQGVTGHNDLAVSAALADAETSLDLTWGSGGATDYGIFSEGDRGDTGPTAFFEIGDHEAGLV
jgi:hypothetical protein